MAGFADSIGSGGAFGGLMCSGRAAGAREAGWLGDHGLVRRVNGTLSLCPTHASKPCLALGLTLPGSARTWDIW